MTDHEARLMMMLNLDSGCGEGLDEADRAAIRWALRRIDQLKFDLDEMGKALDGEHLIREKGKANIRETLAILNRQLREL